MFTPMVVKVVFSILSQEYPRDLYSGPVLFLVFINDMSMVPFKGLLSLFADDTALFYFGREADVFVEIEQYLELLERWCHLNYMLLNPSKTMLFLVNQLMCLIMILIIILLLMVKQFLDLKKSVFLSLHMDRHLSWHNHIDAIKNNLYPVLAALPRLKKILPRSYKLAFYHSMIHCRLTYLNFVWGTFSAYKINELCVLQNRAIRLLFAFPFFTPINVLYSTTNIKPLPISVLISAALSIYKVLKGIIVCINTDFCTNSGIYPYFTRGRNNLVTPRVESSKYGSQSVLSFLLST